MNLQAKKKIKGVGVARGFIEAFFHVMMIVLKGVR